MRTILGSQRTEIVITLYATYSQEPSHVKRVLPDGLNPSGIFIYFVYRWRRKAHGNMPSTINPNKSEVCSRIYL